MVDLRTGMLGVSLLLQLNEYQLQQEQLAGGDGSGDGGAGDGESSADSGSGSGTATPAADGGQQSGSETAQAVRELVEQEQVTSPSPDDRDAFASAVVDLQAGETVSVTVEPLEGYTLRVQEILFDRKTGHEYQFNVGGDVTAVSHRARYAKPQRVSQGDRVVAEATNTTSSTTTLDFEMKAWAEKGVGNQ